jgi:folate-binding protein YgfZ
MINTHGLGHVNLLAATRDHSSLPPADGMLRLADWALLRAEGADAAGFLQGQLTQDMQSLSPGQARLAGYCSAKGRLLCTFIVWRDAPERFFLAVSADLLAPMLKRLSMFVLRAKCRLSDASAEFPLYGMAGATALAHAAGLAPWQWRSDAQATWLRLPDVLGSSRLLAVLPADAPLPQAPLLQPDRWAWLEVYSGVPRVVAVTSEQFVPQMVNLELVGGVNFQKGCYPGQEVVARSQYRGTLKRRALVFDAEGPLAAGQPVFHSADPGQPAGMVVLAAAAPGGGSSALVEVKLAALEGGSLHADAADGPLLRRSALPYPVPEAAPQASDAI